MTRHFSSQWADTLPNVLDLTHYDEGVFHVATTNPFSWHLDAAASYISAYTVIQELGDLEHTGDWDWYVGVHLRDGTPLGDHIVVGLDDGPYCDSIRFTDAKTWQDVARFSGVITGRTLTLDMWGDSEPVQDIKVKLIDVASIHIGQR